MAKKFIVTIRSTGGDYSTCTAAEAALQSNLTDAANKVFSITLTQGTIDDGDTVTGQTSGATGVCFHASSTQIYMAVTSGAFQSGEEIRGSASERATLNDTGDSPIISIQPYNDWPTGLLDHLRIDGWTVSATNYIEVYVPLTERHDGTPKTGFYLKNTTAYYHTLDTREHYTKIYGLDTDESTSGCCFYSYGTNTIIDACIGVCLNAHNSYAAVFTNLGSAKVRNTLIIMPAGGIYSCYRNNTHYTVDVDNCGAVGGWYGYQSEGTSSGMDVRNSWSYSSSIAGFTGTFMASSSSDYCMSDDDTEPGANSPSTDVVSSDFVDPTNDDYSLTSGAGLIDQGVDLSTDFTNDIVGETRGAIWDIGPFEYVSTGGTIFQDYRIDWQVLEQVLQDSDLRWQVVEAVSQDSDLRWQVAELISQDSELQWNIGGGLSQDLDLRWTISNELAQDLDLRWSIFNGLAQDLDLQWQVAGLVFQDSDLRWNIGGGVSQDLELRWEIANLLATDVEFRWQIAELISQDSDLQWNIGGGVAQDLDLRWQVFNQVIRDADLRWQVLEEVSQISDLRWRINDGTGNEISLQWAIISNAVAADLDLNWQIINQVAQSMDLNWQILESVTNDVALRWQILKVVSNAIAVDWQIINEVGGDLDIQWGIAQEVGGNLLLRWQVQGLTEILPPIGRILVIPEERRILVVDEEQRIVIAEPDGSYYTH